MGDGMGSYDPVQIKQAVDLVALAGAETALRRVSGDEYAGPCPVCGGTDRFHVTPEWWFCRKCHERRGDVIEYARWRHNLTFPDACALLGGQQQAQQARKRPPGSVLLDNAPRSAPVAPPIPDTAPPGDLWQARARSLVAHCAALLWENDTALAYLRDRGLLDDTIRGAGLGWSPGFPTSWRARGDDPAKWGLDPAKYKAGVRIPRGWVIPCAMDGVLWYVKVRRPQADIDADLARNKDGNKYLCIPGSVKRGAIYGLDDARGAVDVILAEGEINALILRQELAGVAAVVSVGDAGNRPGVQALDILARIPRPWAAYDPDTAGKHGAEVLGAMWSRVRNLLAPKTTSGNKYDINDALLDGVDLPAWAIPQIGPQGEKRGAWVAYNRERMQDRAGDGGPVDRVLAALQSGAPVDVLPAVLAPAMVPDPAPQVVKSRAGLQWADDPDLWQAAPAPEWAPPEIPGYPRRWWYNATDDLWRSVT